MLIKGKSLQEHINELPYGKFAALARKEVDPLWGRENGEGLKAFRVTVCYYPTRVAEEEIVIVKAEDEDKAKELACVKVSDDIGSHDEIWAHRVEVIGNE